MSDRSDYVESLRREREFVAQRGHDDARVAKAQAQIDAELARYDDEPKVRVRETAVPGPTSRAKARAATDRKN